MKLIDIENLSAADLKAQRAACIDVAKKSPLEEVAARYVQARTDATVRDEKLGEQGRTIDSLNAALAAAAARESELVAGLDAAKKRIEELTVALSAKCKDCTDEETTRIEQVGQLSKQLAAVGQVCNRLKAEATRNNEALSGAYKLLGDALAAQRIDNAVTG